MQRICLLRNASRLKLSRCCIGIKQQYTTTTLEKKSPYIRSTNQWPTKAAVVITTPLKKDETRDSLRRMITAAQYLRGTVDVVCFSDKSEPIPFETVHEIQAIQGVDSIVVVRSAQIAEEAVAGASKPLDDGLPHGGRVKIHLQLLDWLLAPQDESEHASRLEQKQRERERIRNYAELRRPQKQQQQQQQQQQQSQQQQQQQQQQPNSEELWWPYSLVPYSHYLASRSLWTELPLRVYDLDEEPETAAANEGFKASTLPVLMIPAVYHIESPIALSSLVQDTSKLREALQTYPIPPIFSLCVDETMFEPAPDRRSTSEGNSLAEAEGSFAKIRVVDVSEEAEAMIAFMIRDSAQQLRNTAFRSHLKKITIILLGFILIYAVASGVVNFRRRVQHKRENTKRPVANSVPDPIGEEAEFGPSASNQRHIGGGVVNLDPEKHSVFLRDLKGKFSDTKPSQANDSTKEERKGE